MRFDFLEGFFLDDEGGGIRVRGEEVDGDGGEGE